MVYSKKKKKQKAMEQNILFTHQEDSQFVTPGG